MHVLVEITILLYINNVFNISNSVNVELFKKHVYLGYIRLLHKLLFKRQYDIQQRCIKLIKSKSKDTYNVTKDLYFKLILFFCTFYSSVNPENKNVSWFPQKYCEHDYFQH